MTERRTEDEPPTLDQMVRAAEEALVVSAPLFALTVSAEDRLASYALGILVLGRQLQSGVLAEATADPPRGLNAIRLARHLWEAELELHYVVDDPEPRLDQVSGREARNRLNIPRFYRPLRPKKKNPEMKAILLQAEKRAESLDAKARRRREDGEEVPASEYGSVPDWLIVATSIGRKKEYNAVYNPASQLSHPSILGMDNYITWGPGGTTIHVETQPKAGALPGMAVFLAATTYARLAKRAAGALGAEAEVAALLEYMNRQGIPEQAPV